MLLAIFFAVGVAGEILPSRPLWAWAWVLAAAAGEVSVN